MRKATLEFTLPEEQEEFDLAQDGARLKFAIDEIDEWLRGLDKYAGQSFVDISEVRKKLAEALYGKEL